VDKERELNLLKDMRVLTVQTIESMIDGCQNVRNEPGIHQDAKDLAREVLHRCNTLLMFIKEKQ